MRFVAIVKMLCLVASLALFGCNDDIAPTGSTITVLPSGVDLQDIGVAGDRTFATFIAEVRDPEGNPTSDIEVEVTTFFLRVQDANGVFQDPPATTFRTDDNGQVVFVVEVPIQTASYREAMQVNSGIASSGPIEIEVSPAE